MLQIDAVTAEEYLDFATLIERLNDRLADGFTVPQRHQHTVTSSSGADGTMVLMPGWTNRGANQQLLGLKLVNIFPGNNERSLPALSSTYLMFDGETGFPQAMIDGNTLTNRRTAATAALAARYLSRSDSSNLLVIGAGRVGSLIYDAMKCVRRIVSVAVWDVDAAASERLVQYLRQRHGIDARVAHDLPAEAAKADIISTATLATRPIIKGEWLRPGTHVDLIGGFTPAMREADDDVIKRARVFIDNSVALKEAGDLVQPISAGIISEQELCGTLEELTSGKVTGRSSDEEITCFKSVGSGLTDLIAAGLIWERESAAATLADL